jgi:uncharacterized SAM-binding protein YcdF (DUF218 family)
VIVRAISFLVLGWALGFALFVVTLPGPADGQVTDGIVALTGGPNRIGHSLDLLRQRRAKRVLVSGVDRTVRPHELAIENDVPVALFACCVDLGHEAVDTRSNAEETAAWVKHRGYRSIRLVTTDYHMPRASLELAHALDGDAVILRDAVPSVQDLARLVTEYNKYLFRRVAVGVGL